MLEESVMLKVVITGTSYGIGRAIAELFLERREDCIVVGLDRSVATIEHERYVHCRHKIDGYNILPHVDDVDILINNAGTQSEYDDNIDMNLRGLMQCTEEYGLQPRIKAIVNIASTSAHNGAEFPQYVASKGGVLAYTKWTAMEVAKYGATCNSISPGGVVTGMNKHILEDPDLYKQVLDETLLNRWASAEEIAEWVYFVAVVNKSMTGQDIIIDNGELSKFNFVW